MIATAHAMTLHLPIPGAPEFLHFAALVNLPLVLLCAALIVRRMCRGR